MNSNKDDSKRFVIPVKNTHMFVFTSSFLSCFLGQLLLSDSIVTPSLVWVCFGISLSVYFIYVAFLIWIAYRSFYQKPIDPFIFLSLDTKVEEPPNDSLSE